MHYSIYMHAFTLADSYYALLHVDVCIHISQIKDKNKSRVFH